MNAITENFNKYKIETKYKIWWLKKILKSSRMRLDVALILLKGECSDTHQCQLHTENQNGSSHPMGPNIVKMKCFQLNKMHFAHSPNTFLPS